MASINIMNIQVLDNPCIFTTGFRFEVTFECVADLTAGERAARHAAAPHRGRAPPAPAVAAMAPPLVDNTLSPACLRGADLEWKVTYVGSASSPEFDQELENVLVGPVPMGTSKFILSVRACACERTADWG